MIVPGNIREWPRGLDRAALIRRVVDNSMALCTEAVTLQGAALELPGISQLTDGMAHEVLDRLTIARAEIDIVKRIINNATNHEIHNGD